MEEKSYSNIFSLAKSSFLSNCKEISTLKKPNPIKSASVSIYLKHNSTIKLEGSLVLILAVTQILGINLKIH